MKVLIARAKELTNTCKKNCHLNKFGYHLQTEETRRYSRDFIVARAPVEIFSIHVLNLANIIIIILLLKYKN
jgi:hypothetical protein